MQKQKVTVWPDSRVIVTGLGEIDSELVQDNMALDRYRHASFASTVAIEQTDLTLTVVKDTGTVHVYTWFE